MRIIVRTNLFFKTLTYCSKYGKSFHFGSKFTNAQQIFSQSISRACENYSHLEDDHSFTLHSRLNQQSAMDLKLELSPLIAQKDQEITIDGPLGDLKPQRKLNPAKSTKKQSKSSKNMAELHKNLFENLQNSLIDEYPALNYLNESLKVNMSEKLPGDNLLESSYLSIQERDQNSVQFMKIIGHSMPLESSSKIIKLIENYCCSDNNRQIDPVNKTIVRRNFEEIRSEERDRIVFKILKKKLQKQLCNEEHKSAISASFINKLLNSFKKTNPFRITMEEFQNSCAPLKQRNMNPENHIDIKMIPENIVLKQCLSSLKPDLGKQEESLKYAYVYEMPYTLCKEEAIELINHFQNTKNIKIDSYAIFPYKNTVDFQHQDIAFSVPENYKEEDSRIQKSYSSFSIDQFTKSKKNNKKLAGLPKPANSEHLATHANSEKILAKMKQESYLRYNKSSMVIKFHTREDKEKLVTNSTRLFGMTYKQLQNIKLEQACQKTTLVISGIPVGCTSKKLIDVLNEVLSQHSIPIEGSEDSYFSTQSLNLQFQYFTDTLKALELLNNIQFEGRKLKAQIKYGSIKLHKGEYIQQPEQNVQIVRKIMDVRDDYYHRFEELDQLEIV